jgi:hypothetical protein
MAAGHDVLHDLIDLQNALAPTPGVFGEGGHDYRRIVPEALRTVFRLSATEAQMVRPAGAAGTRTGMGSQAALGRHRVDAACPAAAGARGSRTHGIGGVGHAVDDAAVEEIIDTDTQPG